MIVLDTDVLSEAMRAKPDPAVLRWLSSSDVRGTYTTSISIAEILTGIGMLPRGKRRDFLRAAADGILTEMADRVLAFDMEASRLYAAMQEVRRAAARPLSVEDGMIAAICAREGARLATRNTRDFEHLGIEMLDPWVDGNAPA